MNKLRRWIWLRLVILADRISPDDAFRYTGMSMSLRKGHGWVLSDDQGVGVQIWYKGDKHYAEHSHDLYDEEVETKGIWVRIPGYDDYEINSQTHIVRDRITKNTIQTGFDPMGIDREIYVELLNTVGRERYVKLNWIIETSLKGKKYVRAQTA